MSEVNRAGCLLFMDKYGLISFMSLKLPTSLVLPLLMLVPGRVSNLVGLPGQNEPTVSAGQTCTQAKLAAELGETQGNLEFVVAAGPNRFSNLPTTVALINEIAGQTQGKLALVLRIDEGEVPAPLYLGRGTIDAQDPRLQTVLERLADAPDGESIVSELSGLNPTVDLKITVQQMGTSYTEVAHSIAETDAENLVFLAHNWPLQSRLTLAADNAVSAQTYPKNLRSVHVLCHDASGLPDTSIKEVGSLTVDKLADLFGHQFIMETSDGGHRWGRIQEKLFSFVGDEGSL